jgi:hypothetical protein
MTLEITQTYRKQIISFIVVDENLPLSSAASILKYVKAGNFLQILYSYQFSVLIGLLNLFEYEENYKACAIIRDTVINYNKSTGKNLQLK